MLSSDKNVESIAQLVDSVKSYVGLQGEYLKLDVIQKVVRLVTALTLTIVLLLLGIAFLFYLSFACVYWLEPLIGIALAFFVIALFFLAILILVFINRKKWIERPLVRFLLTYCLINERNMENKEKIMRGGYSYSSLEEIQLRKDELKDGIQQQSDQIATLWRNLISPKTASSKGELVASLVTNSITAIDGFLLVRKLMRSYGYIFGRKKRK